MPELTRDFSLNCILGKRKLSQIQIKLMIMMVKYSNY
jgi:hypothetical protein